MSDPTILTVSAKAMTAMARLAADNCVKTYNIKKPEHITRLNKYIADEQHRRDKAWFEMSWWGKFNNPHPRKQGKVPPLEFWYGDHKYDKASSRTEHMHTHYMPYFISIAEATGRAAKKDVNAMLSISIHNFNLIERFATNEGEEK